MGKPCRHCKTRSANRPRGLCDHCYYSPVRGLYSTSTHWGARRGFGNQPGPRGEPVPTDHPPGSMAKVMVLMQRAAAGQKLWSKFDRRECGPGTIHVNQWDQAREDVA